MKKDVNSAFWRHLLACRNIQLPDGRLPFRIGAVQVGWIKPEFARALAWCASITRDHDGGLRLSAKEAKSLPAIAREMAERGFFRWRDEPFPVRAHPSGAVLAEIDRGALPDFGILARGVHVNGLVRRQGGLYIWVARRADNKSLDPGKLDHIVAGGVASGYTPRKALIKEAAEEATIPPSLAIQARMRARIPYVMERPEGLRRDVVYAYDLELPYEFVPHPGDGEVAGFELWPIDRVIETVRETDDFKFNVNLVLIDLFLRLELIPQDDRLHLALRRAH